MEINIFDRIQLGYYLCVALGIIAGMLIMACAREQRGDLDATDDIEHFDFWIDD